jgi:diguanylate cyclase (GGDEF)-like protein
MRRLVKLLNYSSDIGKLLKIMTLSAQPMQWQQGSSLEALELLHQLTLALSAEDNTAELLTRLLEGTLRFCGGSSAAVYVGLPDGRLEMQHGVGHLVSKLGQIFEAGEGVTGWVFRHQQAILVSDYQASKFKSPRYSNMDRSLMAAPLRQAGQVFGVLTVIWEKQIGAYQIDHLELLERFAAFASIAIENATLRAEQERQNRETQERAVRRDELQQHLAEVIVRLEPFEALQELLQRCGRMLSAVGGLAFMRSSTSPLELLVDQGQNNLFHTGNEPFLRQALQGKPVVINQYALFTERVQSYAQGGVQGILAVALQRGQEKAGLIFFERHHQIPFLQNDIDLVLQIAPVLGGLLENARLYLEARVARTEAEQRAGLLEAIYRTYLELGHSEDIKALALGLLARVTSVLGADAGGVYLRNGEMIQLIADYGDEFVQEAPLGYGVSGTVVVTGQAILLEDYALTAYHHQTDPGVLWHSVISVPLRQQQQVIGALTLVDTRFAGRFRPDDLEALERFAAIASLAFENVMLLDTTKQSEQRAKAQTQQLQLLHQASLAVSRHAPKQQWLHSILVRAAQLLGANDGSVYMLHENGRIETAAQLRVEADLDHTIDRDHGISGQVIDSGLPIMVQDYQNWEHKPEPELEPYWQSALGVPLHLNHEVIGALTLAHTTNPKQFVEEDLATLERFAAMANVALENTALLETAQTSATQSEYQTRLLEALYQTNLALAGQLEPSVLLQQLVDRVATLFNADSGAVYLTQGNFFERVACFGESPSVSGQLGQGLSGKVITEKQGRIVADYFTWDGRDHGRDNIPLRWKAAMSAPLWRGEEVIGALTIADTRSRDLFTTTDLEALKRFAASATAALENSRLFHSQRLAEQQAQERSAQMEALHEINLELGQYLDLDLLLESILERAVMLIGGAAGHLDLRQTDSTILREAAVIGNEPSRQIELGQGASGRVALHGQPLLIDNYQTWEFRLFDSKAWQSVISVPLHRGKEIIGALTIANEQGQAHFRQMDLETLQRFAASASLALERAKLLDDARTAESEALTRARQLEALHQVSLEVSKNLEPEALLSSVLERAAALLGANAGAVYLLEKNELVVMVGMGRITIPRVQLGAGISGRVALNGEPILVDDYQTWHGAIRNADTTWRSVASVPLSQGDRVIGALTLADTSLAGRFGLHDLETLKRFASLASIALENARLYIRERNNLRDEKVRARIMQEVARLRSVSDLVRAVLGVLEETLGYQHITLYLLDGQILRLQGQVGDTVPHFEMSLQEGVTGRVARSGLAELVMDGRKDPDFILDTPDLTSMICVPLRGSQQILGTLNIEASFMQPLNQTDLEMLDALSVSITTALENALLHEQIERKASEMEFLRFQAERAARFDTLTNLRNRRAFDEDLQRTLERQGSIGFSLAAIDLTGFKSVNDRFGHAIGDQALARVAKVLSSAPTHRGRALHKTYRTGGDEFILIIPYEQPALEILMHITRGVENLDFHDGLRLGLNIGLASYPHEAKDLDQLQSLADNRMYKAKTAGKPYLIEDELESPPIPRRRASDRNDQ